MSTLAEINSVQDWLLAAGLAVGGLVALSVLAVLAAIGYGFFVAPRTGRPLRYGGIVGAIEAVMRWILRHLHRARLVGFDGVAMPSGGFIVVANHNSGLDAPLMQFAMPRKVRFMMAADQMHPALSSVWRELNVLPVTYGPEDASMLRQATRHVKEGGIVGLFPERGIAKERNTIDPFAEGVGVLVALTKAPVVLCWAHGARTAGSALLDPVVPRSRAYFEFVGIYDFAKEGIRDPAEICRRLREALAAKSRWPLK